MECDHCRQEAIVFQPYSGQHLCDHHFSLDVERRAKRIIRANGWIRPNARTAIMVSGDDAGVSLVHFFATVFGERRDLSFFVVLVDDPKADRASAEYIGEIARTRGWEWIRVVMQDRHETALGKAARPEYHGREQAPVLDDRIIRRIAQEKGATQLALASTLEDEACEMMRDVLWGDVSRLYRTEGENTLPLIRPFAGVPEQEVIFYARIQGLQESGLPARSGSQSREEIRAMLEDFTFRHPSTPFALANLRAELMIGKSTGPIHRHSGQPGEDIFRRSENMKKTPGEDQNAV
ncbi:MAG: hypothetical protein LUO93_07020 [Methanomicrobiales archaeon]|nr:hypothetical protein [Methanomicrobiales archaeon]